MPGKQHPGLTLSIVVPCKPREPEARQALPACSSLYNPASSHLPGAVPEQMVEGAVHLMSPGQQGCTGHVGG